MRFALLGDHADGLDMARALAGSGRHVLTAYSGPASGADYLRRWGLEPRRVPDLEEVLADPHIEGVIVAGSPGQRAAQLRRALQSERHVLCVHPVAERADAAYEAAMLQGDTGCVLLPLLPLALHPALKLLAEAVRAAVLSAPADASLLIEVKRWSREGVLLGSETGQARSLPGWEMLRVLGGEIAEVFALSTGDDLSERAAVLLSGRFVQGAMFQATFLPFQEEDRLHVVVTGPRLRGELDFAEGWPGPARLTLGDEQGKRREESWLALDPWPALALAFEAALNKRPNRARPVPGSFLPDSLTHPERTALGWQDEVRALELDEAARRSIVYRRSSTLDFQAVTEEAGFKGTMTLVGCSLIWVSLILLIMSVWVPWLGWLILPVFGVFLVLQLLRWAVPAKPEQDRENLV